MVIWKSSKSTHQSVTRSGRRFKPREHDHHSNVKPLLKRGGVDDEEEKEHPEEQVIGLHKIARPDL